MFRKKEQYVENHGILKIGKDYHVYHMKPIDYVIAFALGMGAGFLVFLSFFSNIIVSLIAGGIGAAIAPSIVNRFQKKRTIKHLREQFKDLLDSLCASYSVGKNTMGSFAAAERDMDALHGDKSDIVDEVKIINSGLNNNIKIELMLQDFAERSGIEDIKSFADVFEACNRQGGNIRDIIIQTRDIINEKIEMEMEMEALLSGSKGELYIMSVMPVVIILMLNGLGTGTANENTLTNILLKTGCLVLFTVAILIGYKITDIKV